MTTRVDAWLLPNELLEATLVLVGQTIGEFALSCVIIAWITQRTIV